MGLESAHKPRVIPRPPGSNGFPAPRFIVKLFGFWAFVFFLELGDINTFSFAAPAILQQWHLSITSISIIVSATFLGMFIGAVNGGWISDRVGRKRALIATTLWYSLFSLLNAFAWNLAGLFVARMLTGMGLSAMTVVGITYISEMFPALKRGTYQGWIVAIGLLGITATAYVARYLIPIAPWGWRLVFVWGSLGTLILVFGRSLVESPRWYEMRGQTDQADAVLAGIEKRVRAECGELPVPSEPPSQTVSTRSYRDLFSPAYLRQTVVLMVAYIGQTLGFYGFMAWVPTLLVAHGFSLVNSLAWSSAITIGAVPGALLAALISDRWERRWLITIVALVIAGCGVPYGMSFKTTAIIIFGFLVAMFIQTFAPLLYAYTPEAYPTEIRNSGSGLVYGVGRLANTLGPLLIAFFYRHYGYTYVFLYVSACWVLVAIAVGGFGLKTTARGLEQLSEPPGKAGTA
jgi:MFS transporter, putative metabolite:H+ symporter